MMCVVCVYCCIIGDIIEALYYYSVCVMCVIDDCDTVVTPLWLLQLIYQ